MASTINSQFLDNVKRTNSLDDEHDINKVRRYEQWRTGQLDRLYDKPCCSTNGDYLDGWYNPNQVVPDFLTMNEAFTLKRHFDNAYSIPTSLTVTTTPKTS